MTANKPIEVKFYRHKEYKEVYLCRYESRLETTQDLIKAITHYSRYPIFFEEAIKISSQKLTHAVERIMETDDGFTGIIRKDVELFVKDFELVTLTEPVPIKEIKTVNDLDNFEKVDPLPKYIKTQDNIYKVKGRICGFYDTYDCSEFKPLETSTIIKPIHIKNYEVIKTANSIEELCDEFVLKENGSFRIVTDEYSIEDLKAIGTNCHNQDSEGIYGAIWTNSCLSFVAEVTIEGKFAPILDK